MNHNHPIPPTIPAAWQGEAKHFALRVREILESHWTALKGAPLKAHPVGTVLLYATEESPARQLGGQWRMLQTEGRYHLWERVG